RHRSGGPARAKGDDGVGEALTAGGMMLELQLETLRRVLGGRQELGIGVLRQQDHPPIVPEVDVAKLRMAVEPQSRPDEGVEVTGEEVGEEERARLGVV